MKKIKIFNKFNKNIFLFSPIKLFQFKKVEKNKNAGDCRIFQNSIKGGKNCGLLNNSIENKNARTASEVFQNSHSGTIQNSQNSKSFEKYLTKALLEQMDFQFFAKAEDEGRTEDPTEHKLKKAREEGRVAKSQELNNGLVLLFPVLALILTAPWLLDKFVQIIRFYFTRFNELDFTDGIIARAFFDYFVKMMLPIALAAIVAGIAGNIIQNRGFIFSTKPIAPKFSKIVPKFGEYFRKTLFSFEGAFNVVKSIVKVAIIVFAAFLIIKSDIEVLLSLLGTSVYEGIKYIGFMTGKLLMIASVVFILIAIPDYLVQRRQFMESLKMSKQEIKEEFKELEGDPLVKSRLKQRMHEMLQQNMPKLVSEADVVITNPTHFACVIKYDRNSMPGPMLTAKGADLLAQRIKEIARENNVPIMENRPLARALYAEVEIGDIIPETYYQALATILAKVYSMNKKTRPNYM